jgi:hypothetical protein
MGVRRVTLCGRSILYRLQRILSFDNAKWKPAFLKISSGSFALLAIIPETRSNSVAAS